MDYFKIGALKVFADIGALIEEDEKNKTKFTDLPTDILEIVKGHVTNFKDNKDEYNFLGNFRKGENKDLYKFFFNKDLYFFTSEKVLKYIDTIGNNNRYEDEYVFYITDINLKNILEYINQKYKKDYRIIRVIYKFNNGFKNPKNSKFYIDIGYGEARINNNNTLQIHYGKDYWTKEYNIPNNLKSYLNDNVWNIKNIL